MTSLESLESRRLLDGLTGQYFGRADFTELRATRTDAGINFTWPDAPTRGVPADKFSVRWTGQVLATTDEVYTFYALTDDGARLWVDGKLLVDNWVVQGATEKSASVALEAGKRYDIRLDYYDSTNAARARLSWSTPTIAKQTIPAAQLFDAPAGLAATFFHDTQFTRPVVSRIDANVNATWPTGSPDPSVAADGFSARWSGYVVPDFDETYTFYVNALAGSSYKLRVDGQLLRDSTAANDDGRIALEGHERYFVSLEYASPSGAAGVHLQWKSPSTPLAIVPTASLVSGAATAIPSTRTTYTNPVVAADWPDPGILRSDNAYWMLHTTGGPDTGWPLYKSTDGVTWTFVKNLLTTANKQPWMNGNYWAAELHKVGDNFVLTGTSIDSRSGWLTIVMASSATIDGTYIVRSEPLVANASEGSIDSHIFQDDDGRKYLVWKRGGNYGTIRIRELDSTGLEFAAGSSERVILDNLTGGWERNLAEAPWIIRREDYYYLFYSGANIDTSYSLGVARSTSLNTMFSRNPANPIISNNTTWGGPGHGGFALDNDGTLWHLYHARPLSNPNLGRYQVLDPVVWAANGWPTFAGNSVGTTAKPGPRVNAASGAGLVTLAGTSAADTIRVVRGTDLSTIEIYLNNTLSRTVPFSTTQMITLDGGSGANTLTLDFTKGDLLAGGGISYAGGSGTDTVRVIGTNGQDVFRDLATGAFAMGSGLFASTSVEKFILDGGTHRLLAGRDAVSVEVASGTATIDATQKIAALIVDAGATAAIAPGGTLVANALTLLGKLDLGDGTLVIDYVAGASPLAAITSYVVAGRASGAWNGTTGIVSGIAAAGIEPAGDVGAGEASSLFATATTFAGVSVDTSAVVVRYTLSGDADLNRTVDTLDFARLVAGFGQPRQMFTGGNFNYDANVDSIDFNLLIAGYGRSAGALPLPVAQRVLESDDDESSLVAIV